MARKQYFNNTGFTLLDLIIVILILAVLAVMVTPHISVMQNESKLNAAVSEIFTGLQYAANLAIKYQHPFCLEAQVAGNWFKVVDESHQSDSSPHYDFDPPIDAYGVVLNPADKKWYVVNFDDSLYAGVHITGVPTDEQVCFYPDGHTSASDKNFSLANGDLQKIVEIDAVTGRIHVQ